MLVALALGKSAKAATIDAYVGVIDIAVDNITNGIAAHTLAQFIGRSSNFFDASAFGGKKVLSNCARRGAHPP